jgi:F-type H+-transporting ATPase subunit epsilon
MSREFALSVVAPDKAVVEESVTSIVAPGQEGYFGVYKDHEPLIAALRPGMVEYTDKIGTKHFVYVGGGFAEVTGTRVTILADEAATATEIDIARAEQDIEDAKKALRGGDSPLNSPDAVLAVERAVERLKAARAARGGSN